MAEIKLKNGQTATLPEGQLTPEETQFMVENAASPEELSLALQSRAMRVPKDVEISARYNSERNQLPPTLPGMTDLAGTFQRTRLNMKEWREHQANKSATERSAKDKLLEFLYDRVGPGLTQGVLSAATGGGSIPTGLAAGAFGAAGDNSTDGKFLANTLTQMVPGGKAAGALQKFLPKGALGAAAARFAEGAGVAGGAEQVESLADRGRLTEPSLGNMAVGGALNAGVGFAGDKIRQNLIGDAARPITDPERGGTPRYRELKANEEISKFLLTDERPPAQVQPGASSIPAGVVRTETEIERAQRKQQLDALVAAKNYEAEQKAAARVQQKRLDYNTVVNNQAITPEVQGAQANIINARAGITKRAAQLRALSRGFDPTTGKPLSAVAPTKLGAPPRAVVPDPMTVMDETLASTKASGAFGGFRNVAENPLALALKDLFQESLDKSRNVTEAVNALRAQTRGGILTPYVDAFVRNYKDRFKAADVFNKAQQKAFLKARQGEISAYAAQQRKALEATALDAPEVIRQNQLSVLTKVSTAAKLAQTNRAMAAAVNNIEATKRAGAKIGIDIAQHDANIKQIDADLSLLKEKDIYADPVLNQVLGNKLDPNSSSKIAENIYGLGIPETEKLMSYASGNPRLGAAIRDTFMNEVLTRSYDTKANRFDMTKLRDSLSEKKMETIMGPTFVQDFRDFQKFVSTVEIAQKQNAEIRKMSAGTVAKASYPPATLAGLGMGGAYFVTHHPGYMAAGAGAAALALPFNKTFWNWLAENKGASWQLFKWAEAGSDLSALKSFPLVRKLIKEVGIGVNEDDLTPDPPDGEVKEN